MRVIIEIPNQLYIEFSEWLSKEKLINPDIPLDMSVREALTLFGKEYYQGLLDGLKQTDGKMTITNITGW